MDINACYPICELPNVNGYTNETHELVRSTMREEKLEFPSNATEAKNIVIVLRFYLWEANVRRGSFCGEVFYNVNPYI